MSGGSLDYFYCQLQDHIGDFGDKELDELVKDLAELFHDREWYLSADYGIGDWNQARDNFKKKWFTKEGRKARIDKRADRFGLDGLCLYKNEAGDRIRKHDRHGDECGRKLHSLIISRLRARGKAF